MKRIFVLLSFAVLTFRLIAQVTPQTGTASFSLPMFNWQDDKSRLNAAVGLNYSSGTGLKVDELASNVGQGWNLIAGGSITRMQIGEPDDQIGQDGGIEDITKFPAGLLFEINDPSSGCPKALSRYPIFRDKNHIYKQHNEVAADRELDRFAFQFNGRTGLFILDKYTLDRATKTGQGVILGDSRMKVWFDFDMTKPQEGIRNAITCFYIQDENGLIYKFATSEKTKVLKYGFCDPEVKVAYTQHELKKGEVSHETSFDTDIDPVRRVALNQKVVNGWYLTEIRDPLIVDPTKNKITISYNVLNINAEAGIKISYNNGKDYSIISHAVSVTETPQISTINFPDGHKVAFTYGRFTRVDLNGDFPLASVDITYNNRFLTKYQLKTTYLIYNRYGTPSTIDERSAARLCLRSVIKVGVDLKANDQPYLFDYYLGSGNDDVVPARFSFRKDIWGYYNGDASRDFNNATIPLNTTLANLNNSQTRGLCFLRNNASGIVFNPKSGYAKNGLLKEISYPAGGTLTYEYQQNEGIINGETTSSIVGGVHVSKTSLTDGGYSNGCDNPIVTNYSYTATHNSPTSSLWGLEKPNNLTEMYSYYEPEQKFFYYKPLATFACDYRFQYPGILSREQAVSLTGGQQFALGLSKALEIVGGIMTVLDIVNVCLAGTPANFVAVILDIIAIYATVILTCGLDRSKSATDVVFYNYDLNSSNPLPTQFKRVEVTESSGSAVNGRTEMEFTSLDETPIWEMDNKELSMKQRFAYWAYGLPTLTTVYDAKNNIVKQTENKYDWSLVKGSFGTHGLFRYPSCKCMVKTSTSQNSVDWSDPAKFNASSEYLPDNVTYPDPNNADQDLMLVKIYDVYSGRVELRSTFERMFKPGSQTIYLQTSTDYRYNYENFQVNQITTTQSNGDQTTKDITYSVDFYTGNLKTFNDNNIWSVPVSTRTSVTKKNGNWFYLGENVTEFAQLPSGDIKPYRTLEQRFSQPSTSMTAYRGPGDPTNPIYNEVQTLSYDGIGNLVGMKDEGSRLVANIYDYKNKYVVASVINADVNVDKPAYTSFETGSFGGWILNGAGSAVNSSSVTGDYSFPLSASNNLSANINPQKRYLLSFWARSNVSVGAGATLTKSGPLINGYTYYEYSIPQGASAVTLTGTASIDELRIYPQTARMRTVTYDPLIGKTSECDENNRITYYEYDGLSRLRFIKDENRNIVKMYEYNYSTKRPGCTVTYFNNAITETFTKNDCGPNFMASSTTYSIPAGKYSSRDSQEAADQQAENELNDKGQQAANALSCIPLYGNDEKSANFGKQGCVVGNVGSSITYTVPKDKYMSTSKQKANDLADAEIEANGQAYANFPGNASCVFSSEPVWEGTGLEECRSGHLWKQVKDVNPNSSTRNQLQWVDPGPDASCPGTAYTVTFNNYTSDIVYINFTDPVGNKSYSTPVEAGAAGYLAVPAGNYSVSLSSPTYSSFMFSGCSFTYYGYLPHTVYTVNVSDACQVTITNQ
jgi:hypothetical protein